MSGIKIVVAGAAGRMGRTLVRLISETEGSVVAGALEAPDHADLGRDAGVLAGLAANGVPLSSDPAAAFAMADAYVDFTAPRVSVALAAQAAEAGIVAVIGSTGFAAEDDARIRAAAEKTVIVKSGNMSRGVSLLAALVKQAARTLAFDIEILEMHHAQKKDAPSGTALLLGEAAAAARGRKLSDVALRGRDGMTGPRPEGAIGFASLRGGSVVGEHQVIFAGLGERLTLSHSAEDRSIFARGAIAAALWGQGKTPGLYTMADVLGL
jgi:4-hydroxy-tetrahydrodipicolinate reductase